MIIHYLFIYAGECRSTSPHILRYVDKSDIDRVNLHMPIDRFVRHSVDAALESTVALSLSFLYLTVLKVRIHFVRNEIRQPQPH